MDEVTLQTLQALFNEITRLEIKNANLVKALRETSATSHDEGCCKSDYILEWECEHEPAPDNLNDSVEEWYRYNCSDRYIIALLSQKEIIKS